MNNTIRKLIIAICIVVLAFSAYNLVSTYLEYQHMDEVNDAITEQYVDSGDDTEDDPEQPEEEPEVDDEYAKLHSEVDLKSLYERNPEVIGWIQIPDTRVDYPILYPSSTNEYLYADIDHNYLRSGSIFLDSRTVDPFDANNTVIYGHNMKNGSMFHGIKPYVNQDFALEHPYIYIYRLNGTIEKYQVIGAGIIKATNEFYSNYNIDTQTYYSKIKAYSSISIDFDESIDAPIIMLSTCATGSSDELNRYVVHGKLVAIL